MIEHCMYGRTQHIVAYLPFAESITKSLCLLFETSQFGNYCLLMLDCCITTKQVNKKLSHIVKN